MKKSKSRSKKNKQKITTKPKKFVHYEYVKVPGMPIINRKIDELKKRKKEIQEEILNQSKLTREIIKEFESVLPKLPEKRETIKIQEISKKETKELYKEWEEAKKRIESGHKFEKINKESKTPKEKIKVKEEKPLSKELKNLEEKKSPKKTIKNISSLRKELEELQKILEKK